MSDTITHPWRFVEKWYPDYDHADQIAEADDLSKLVDGEINGAAEELLNDTYGGDPENPQIQIDYYRVHIDIYERAIENFLKHNSL